MYTLKNFSKTLLGENISVYTNRNNLTSGFTDNDCGRLIPQRIPIKYYGTELK